SLRMIGQINGRFYSAPPNVLAPESAPADSRVSFAESDHQPEEAKYLRMLAKAFPIQPRGFVILIVRIIVPSLRMQKFVARREHRNAVGKQQQAADIFGLTFAQRYNL